MSKKAKRLSNYEFFIKTNTSRYKGEWIAIVNEKVIAHGKDAEKVYKSAQRKIRSKDISLAKIPEEQMLILKISL